MSKPHRAMLFAFAACAAAVTAAASSHAATDPNPVGSPKVASSQDGKYFDAAGNPTYNISPSGKVDWYTFSGYRRFNGTCETCHGFDGSGSSFAPDLTQSLKTIYVYLRARADGALGGGRPASNEAKPKTAIANENDCMGP